MSTTATTATTAAAVKRKFPPPCWTRDEALVLIEAYRERWYALHRAFLKNPDWDAVADKVTTSCPDVTPPKTSAQCRHKMEKLRQRHRAEKLRASSFPTGRFLSSWFYFEAMEALENGPSSDPVNNSNSNSNSNNNSNNPNVSDITVSVADHIGLNPGRGIRFKPSHVQNLVTLAAAPTNYVNPGFDPRVLRVTSHAPLYTNNWGGDQEDDNQDGYLVDHNHKSSIYTGRIIQEGVPRKFGKVGYDHHEVDGNGDMWVKVPRNRDANEGKKKKGSGEMIHEVVSSIKVLGDGFMKMEMMKIDMVREIERMRMETEMKRNQLILESQKQIVDAFVKGLVEIRKEPIADS